MNIHELFIEKLRAVIAASPRGTQGEIATALGISRGAFSNILNGRNKDSAEVW